MKHLHRVFHPKDQSFLEKMLTITIVYLEYLGYILKYLEGCSFLRQLFDGYASYVS